MAAGIGETLRATRRQQRLSLTEAAAEIRVREPYLAALEEEKFSKLGGEVYVRAFLRGYSEYLGLDPDQIVEAYRRAHERGGTGQISEQIVPPEPPLSPAAPPMADHWSDVEEPDDIDDDDLLDEDRPGSGLSRALVLAGVVLLLLVVTVVGLRSRNSGGEQVAGSGQDVAEVTIPTPSVTPEQPAADAPSEPPPAPSVPEAEASPPPSAPPPPPPPVDDAPLDALNVELRVTDGPSWLRATIDGNVQDVGTQPPGSVFTYQGTQSVLLRIGDCSKVQLIVNGVERPMDCQDRELRDVAFRIGEPPSYGPTTGAPA